jgi:hypothetical protein
LVSGRITASAVFVGPIVDQHQERTGKPDDLRALLKTPPPRLVTWRSSASSGAASVAVISGRRTLCRSQQYRVIAHSGDRSPMPEKRTEPWASWKQCGRDDKRVWRHSRRLPAPLRATSHPLCRRGSRRMSRSPADAQPAAETHSGGDRGAGGYPAPAERITMRDLGIDKTAT